MNTSDSLINSEEFYHSFLNNKNSLLNNDIDTILPRYQNHYHYLCPECQKFPLIEFKNKKNIRITCSCINNQKISISTFLDNIEKNILSQKNLLSSKTNIITDNNNNLNDINFIFPKNFFKKF